MVFLIQAALAAPLTLSLPSPRAVQATELSLADSLSLTVPRNVSRVTVDLSDGSLCAGDAESGAVVLRCPALWTLDPSQPITLRWKEGDQDKHAELTMQAPLAPVVEKTISPELRTDLRVAEPTPGAIYLGRWAPLTVQPDGTLQLAPADERRLRNWMLAPTHPVRLRLESPVSPQEAAHVLRRVLPPGTLEATQQVFQITPTDLGALPQVRLSFPSEGTMTAGTCSAQTANRQVTIDASDPRCATFFALTGPLKLTLAPAGGGAPVDYTYQLAQVPDQQTLHAYPQGTPQRFLTRVGMRAAVLLQGRWQTGQVSSVGALRFPDPAVQQAWLGWWAGSATDLSLAWEGAPYDTAWVLRNAPVVGIVADLVLPTGSGATLSIDPFSLLAPRPSLTVRAPAGSTKLEYTDGAAAPKVCVGATLGDDVYAFSRQSCPALWSLPDGGRFQVSAGTPAKVTATVFTAEAEPESRATAHLSARQPILIPERPAGPVAVRIGGGAWRLGGVDAGGALSASGPGALALTQWIASTTTTDAVEVYLRTPAGVVHRSYVRLGAHPLAGLSPPDGWCPIPEHADVLRVCFDRDLSGFQPRIEQCRLPPHHEETIRSVLSGSKKEENTAERYLLGERVSEKRYQQLIAALAVFPQPDAVEATAALKARAPRPGERHAQLCAGALRERLPPGVVRPNTSIDVRLWHLSGGDDLKLTFSGSATPGLTVGATHVYKEGVTGSGSGGSRQPQGASADAGVTWTSWQLVPRQADGLLSLGIDQTTTGTGGAKETTSVAAVELLTDKRYSGAIRIGFGASVIHGQTSYSVVDSTLIEETAHYPVAPGLDPDFWGPLRADGSVVVGYAPFVFTRAERSWGRSYRLGNVRRLRLAPYVGLSVISSDATFGTAESDVRFLSALHGGLDFEIAPQLSFAVLGTLQQTERLNAGVSVGQVASGATSQYTHTIYRPGLSLVVNVSPKLFRVAKVTQAQDFGDDSSFFEGEQ